jgi:hypothetical protein
MLKLLRSRGWTLWTIANSLGVAHSTVRKWSAGMRYPATSQVVMFALTDLLEEGSVRPPNRNMVTELIKDRIGEAKREQREAERDDRKFPRGLEDLRERLAKPQNRPNSVEDGA